MWGGRHILFVQPSELFGGAERQVAAILPQLQKEGIAVTALVGPSRTIVEWLRDAGVNDVVLSPNFAHDRSEARRLPWSTVSQFLARAAVVEREVESLISGRSIDAVIAAMAFAWVSATPAARRRRVPVIWRAGGMELSLAERMLLKIWAAYHPPDALISNSEGVRRLFMSLVPAPVYVIHNGVDTTLFRPTAAELDRSRGPTIGFAGRLVPQKRPEDFLAMAARIVPRHPEARFLIAGDGSRRRSYENRAAKLGLGDRVQFLGMVKDMRRFYASLDLLVLPSRSEGSPNVVLEAMATGLPIIASDIPTIRELIVHLSDGLLFPVGDIGKLTLAVELALTAPGLRAKIAERALRKVQRCFTAASGATALIRAVEEILAGQKLPRPGHSSRPRCADP
jgi:glycosyltransferase involved in cell wall biosynthesis